MLKNYISCFSQKEFNAQAKQVRLVSGNAFSGGNLVFWLEPLSVKL
jgi:hypothetical protein